MEGKVFLILAFQFWLYQFLGASWCSAVLSYVFGHTRGKDSENAGREIRSKSWGRGLNVLQTCHKSPRSHGGYYHLSCPTTASRVLRVKTGSNITPSFTPAHRSGNECTEHPIRRGSKTGNNSYMELENLDIEIKILRMIILHVCV